MVKKQIVKKKKFKFPKEVVQNINNPPELHNLAITKKSLGCLMYFCVTAIRGGDPDYLIKSNFVVGENKEKGLLVFQETDEKMLRKMAREAKKPNPIVG